MSTSTVILVGQMICATACTKNSIPKVVQAVDEQIGESLFMKPPMEEIATTCTQATDTSEDTNYTSLEDRVQSLSASVEEISKLCKNINNRGWYGSYVTQHHHYKAPIIVQKPGTTSQSTQTETEEDNVDHVELPSMLNQADQERLIGVEVARTLAESGRSRRPLEGALDNMGEDVKHVKEVLDLSVGPVAKSHRFEQALNHMGKGLEQTKQMLDNSVDLDAEYSNLERGLDDMGKIEQALNHMRKGLEQTKQMLDNSVDLDAEYSNLERGLDDMGKNLKQTEKVLDKEFNHATQIIQGMDSDVLFSDDSDVEDLLQPLPPKNSAQTWVQLAMARNKQICNPVGEHFTDLLH